MSTGLVPERRPDKNGVVSTKWVRPASSSAPVSGVPAPVPPVAVVEDWDALKDSMVVRIYGHTALGRRGDFPLSRCGYETVCLVNEALERSPEIMAHVVTAFRHVHEMSLDMNYPGDPLLPLKHVAMFAELAVRPGVGTHEVQALVNGLDTEFGGSRDYLHGVTAEEQRSAIALATVICSLEDEEFLLMVEANHDEQYEPYLGSYNSYLLRNANLADLVKERPDDAEEIASIINERCSDSVELIAEVLYSGHGALNKGAL